jgi:hypothetical protein
VPASCGVPTCPPAALQSAALSATADLPAITQFTAMSIPSFLRRGFLFGVSRQ